MKERPILFSGEMVKAILNSTKTQTRRVIKPQPQPLDNEGWIEFRGRSGGKATWHAATWRATQNTAPIEEWCPHGQPGDQLWVRETWAKWDGGLAYLANTLNRDGKEDEDSKRCRLDYGVKWRPSIFMPREFSRITLEITGVRVERLQEISEQDTAAEGVEVGSDYWDKHFRALWDSINGKKYPWASNPWVWAISFKRIAP